MNTINLDWLPLVCEKVFNGEYTDKHLNRLARECDLEMRSLRQQRSGMHRAWMRLRLSRIEHRVALQAIEWSEAELEYLGMALRHLSRWEQDQQCEELRQARARLQMADQAHRQYLKVRVQLEPMLVERQLRAA